MPFFSSFTGSFSGGRRIPRIGIGGGGGDSFSGDISAATYSSISFDTTAQEQYPDGITFNNNGSKMYIIGPTLDEVYEYSLSTNFDVSSATYTNNKLGYNSQDTRMRDLHFNNDGTKLFLLGDFNTAGSLYQYNLTTPYDLSTASYASISKLLTGFTYNPKGFDFSADGTVLWTIGSAEIVEYSLSSAYDISTISPTGNTLNIFSTTTSAYDGTFVDNGSKFLLLSNGNPSADQDKVRQYSMTTPYDLSTITYDSLDLFIGTQAPLATGIEVSNDETKMIIIDSADAGAMIFEYNIGGSGGGGGAATYTVSGATQSATTQLPGGALVYLNYNADGTEVTTTYNLSKQLYTVALPTPYDPTSGVANYDSGDPNEVINITAGSLAGFRYNNDGTKAFFTHQYANSSPSLVSGHISEFPLSTAYDIFSISSSPNALYDVTGDWYGSNSFNITDINFNTDGSKMFITNGGGLSALGIFEYDLGTEFDLSTATYSQGFDFATDMPADILPRFGTFNSAGTKFYMADIREEYVYEFDLSTGFDVSTMSYNGVFLDISGIDTGLRQVGLSQDETQLYVTGAQNRRIYTFDLVQE